MNEKKKRKREKKNEGKKLRGQTGSSSLYIVLGASQLAATKTDCTVSGRCNQFSNTMHWRVVSWFPWGSGLLCAKRALSNVSWALLSSVRVRYLLCEWTPRAPPAASIFHLEASQRGRMYLYAYTRAMTLALQFSRAPGAPHLLA